MLLVHHREPEIGERDLFLEERMGTDCNVNCALRQSGERSAARSGLVSAGQERDTEAHARRDAEQCAR